MSEQSSRILKDKEVKIVVAVSQNGIIGREQGLPWHLRSDLKRFKRLTMGHALLMGRKTFDSIGKCLPGRHTIVVTRDENFHFENVIRANSIEQAIELTPAGLISFVVGGGQIYRVALPHTDEVFLTRVHANVQGDVRFEGWDPSQWHCRFSEDIAADEENDWPSTYQEWERIKSV